MSMKGYTRVSKLHSKTAKLAGFSYYGDVFASPGVYKHIRKRHFKQLGQNIIDNLNPIIKSILSDPDFVGHNPTKSKTSIELVKKCGPFILLALEYDVEKNYIYVSSLYPLTEGKILNRIHSGRLIPLTSLSKFKHLEKKIINAE